jgi:hypothetical protein
LSLDEKKLSSGVGSFFACPLKLGWLACQTATHFLIVEKDWHKTAATPP